MKLETARKILCNNFKPLGVAVLDARGARKAFATEDGTSLKRAEIATGNAAGALAPALGSRNLGTMAAQRPHFVATVTHAVSGLIPVAGGVLIRNGAGKLLGAFGIFADSFDNDEAAAVAGVAATSLKAPGA